MSSPSPSSPGDAPCGSGRLPPCWCSVEWRAKADDSAAFKQQRRARKSRKVQMRLAPIKSILSRRGSAQPGGTLEVARRIEVVLSNARHPAGGGADSGTTSRSGDSIIVYCRYHRHLPLYILSPSTSTHFPTTSTPSQPRIELLVSSAPLPEPKCLKSTYAINVLVPQKQVC